MTQLNDGICVRVEYACVVGTGLQLHFNFTHRLYDEPYLGFFSFCDIVIFLFGA